MCHLVRKVELDMNVRSGPSPGLIARPSRRAEGYHKSFRSNHAGQLVERLVEVSLDGP